jgi:hypothetical protein
MCLDVEHTSGSTPGCAEHQRYAEAVTAMPWSCATSASRSGDTTEPLDHTVDHLARRNC